MRRSALLVAGTITLERAEADAGIAVCGGSCSLAADRADDGMIIWRKKMFVLVGGGM